MRGFAVPHAFGTERADRTRIDRLGDTCWRQSAADERAASTSLSVWLRHLRPLMGEVHAVLEPTSSITSQQDEYEQRCGADKHDDRREYDSK